MIIDNISKLQDDHFEMIERVFNVTRQAILDMDADTLENLLFSDALPSMYDIMQNVDIDGAPGPTADCLLAEQIQDTLYPADIYNPQNDYTDEPEVQQMLKQPQTSVAVA